MPDGDVTVDDLIRGPVVVKAGAVGDFIIVRSDGAAGYNFATVVDDRDMRITHVIRGDDHLTNTARQLLLFRALGAPVPAFAHHSMVLGAEGGKLSKRHGATSVGDFRELGYLPQALVNYLALLSWSHGEDEVLGMDRLVAEFELEKLSPSPVVFDQAKLDWLDHEHIMGLAPEEHEALFAERLPAGTPPPAAAALAAAFQPSLVAYGQAPELAASVLEPPRAHARVGGGAAGGRPPARRGPPPARRGGRVAGARGRPRACSPSTAPGASRPASAPATCSCRCASPSPAPSTGRSCRSSWRRSTATRRCAASTRTSRTSTAPRAGDPAGAPTTTQGD